MPTNLPTPARLQRGHSRTSGYPILGLAPRETQQETWITALNMAMLFIAALVLTVAVASLLFPDIAAPPVPGSGPTLLPPKM